MPQQCSIPQLLQTIAIPGRHGLVTMIRKVSLPRLPMLRERDCLASLHGSLLRTQILFFLKQVCMSLIIYLLLLLCSWILENLNIRVCLESVYFVEIEIFFAKIEFFLLKIL